jgi:sulfur-oxidizing protein SoxY
VTDFNRPVGSLRDAAIAHAGRRELLIGGLYSLFVLPPAHAATPELRRAIEAFTGGAVVRDGKVVLNIAPLVENGNAVPVTVTVTSPMSAIDHVVSIALFNERNPQPDVAQFTLGPRAERARVSTRMRLATSQQVVALARLNDGSFWAHRVDVIVTLAACIE